MNKRKNKRNELVLSQLLLLIPAAIALNAKLYLYAAVILLTTVTSLAYHLHPKTIWHSLDHVTAIALIFSNYLVFRIAGFDSLYFAAALAFAALAFVFYFRATKQNYVLNHSLWHVFSALITLCSVIAFVVAN